MRADGEPVRLVAQALDEVKHRIARLQHEDVAVGHVKMLAPSIPVNDISAPTERSIPPVRITNVIPTARISR